MFTVLQGLFSTDSGVKKFTLWVKRDSNLSANEQVSVFRKIADILNAIAEKIRNFIKGTRTSGAEVMLTTEERTILEGEEEFAKKLMNMFLDEVDVAIENRNSATVNENAAESKAYSIEVNNEEFKKPITVEDIDTLRSIGRKSISDFTSEDIQKSQKWAYKFYNELGTKSPFFRAWFGDWRANDSRTVTVADIPEYIASNEARKANRGNVRNNDTGWDIRISRKGESDTISHAGDKRLSEYGLAGIRGLIENAVLLDSEIHEHHSNNAKNDLIAFDHKLYSIGKDTNGDVALYRITVEEGFQDPNNTNDKKFHNLKYIEKVVEASADANVEQSHKDGSTMRSSTTDYTISDIYNFVKQYDKEFNAGKEVNSALLNKDGTPKVLYHRTNNDFTVFDIGRSGENQGKSHGDGIYLSTLKNAYSYAGDKVMKLYASISNPFEMELSKAEANKVYDKYFKPYHAAPYNTYRPHVIKSLMSYTKVFDYLTEAAERNNVSTADILSELEYDGVHSGIEWVAFSPSQIKSATDNIGTFDGGNDDIRYSVQVEKKTNNLFGFEIKDGVKVNEDLLEELSLHDSDAKVDSNGNITVYHRTTARNAEEIKRTGVMKAKEDALFFSSKETGYADGYGDTVIELSIPSTVLEVNDIFDGEVHFDIPLKYKNGGFSLDVSKYLNTDSKEETSYSIQVDKPKKSSYNEFETNAMQWANATQRKDGDTRLVYNPKSDEWCLIVSGKEYDGGYGVLEYYSDYEKIPNKIRKGLDYEYGTDERNYSGNNSIVEENGNIEKGRRGNIDSVLYAGENAEAQRVVGNEPERGGTGDIQRGRVNSNGQDVSHSIQVDNLNSRKSLLAQEEKYEKAIKKLKDKVETLRGETKLTRNKKVDRKAVIFTDKTINTVNSQRNYNVNTHTRKKNFGF